jgi:hypothetical protein
MNGWLAFHRASFHSLSTTYAYIQPMPQT